jgi:hypothetical protein
MLAFRFEIDLGLGFQTNPVRVRIIYSPPIVLETLLTVSNLSRNGYIPCISNGLECV